MRTTPDNITALAKDEIFVFGSNYAGRHGRGAARTALDLFGAKRGQGWGFMGQSYGIPTKDWNLKVLSLKAINWEVGYFLDDAGHEDNLTFLVTPIGCGLAGYEPKDIAPMFKKRTANVILPASFLPFV